MRYLIVIQSRYLSKRLPGKALKKVKKKELLFYLIKRIQKNKIFKKKIIVATSKNIYDTKIVKFCKKNNIKYYQGPLNNVFNRYIQIIEKFNLDFVVRINGDSPLIDFRIIDLAIKKFKNYKKNKYDLVTNTLIRSFPRGQSVEVINSNTFIKIKNKIKKKMDQEHVTKYLYDNKKKFNIYNFANNKKLGHINMSVDTKNDFEIFKKIIIDKKFNFNLNFSQILKLNYY